MRAFHALAPLLRLGIALVVPLAVLLVVLGVPTTARADERGVIHEPTDVYWHPEWPKFTLGEALITGAVTIHGLRFERALSGPRESLVEFYVPLMDREARDLFRVESDHRRAAYARMSDIGFRTLVFAPYAIDVGLTLAVHRNPEVAAQLFLIDLEVLTLAGTTQVLVSRLIGRERPYVQGEPKCPPGQPCEGGPYRSLLSGHTMAAFTAAGLMCRHHKELPIFGGGAPDTWACIWGLGVASLTGLFRLPADEHWASDVILGAGLGFVYGYFLPKVLHFQSHRLLGKAASTLRPTLLPSEGGGGVLTVGGPF